MDSLRIATWNCHMGLHTKVAALRSLDADVLVLPEAASPERLRANGFSWEGPLQWIGDSPTKGLLVLARPHVRLRLHDTQFASHHWLLPLVVEVPGAELHLLAVWAMNHRSQGTAALVASGGTTTGIERYTDFLSSPNAAVIRDFNNSVVWDSGAGARNFGHTLRALEDRGLVSAYHRLRSEEQGRESEKTYFHQWRQAFTHHIDYCFTRPGAARSCEVGTFDTWVAAGLSDHVPVVCDIAPTPSGGGTAAP